MASSLMNFKSGLTIVRFAPVVLILSEIAVGGGITQFRPLVVLSQLALLAGLAICYQTGKKKDLWLQGSLIVLASSLLLLLVPRLTLLLTFGLLLGQAIMLILFLVAMLLMLVYLRALALDSKCPKQAAQFRNLLLIPPVALVLGFFAGIVLPTELLLLVPLSLFVIMLVYVVSYSRTVGELIAKLED